MSIELLAELAWKSLLFTALAMVFLAMAGRRSAAEKSLIGDAGLLSLLMLPIAIAWLPSFEFAAPATIGGAIEQLGLEPAMLEAGTIAGQPAPGGVASAFDWNALALALYGIPAMALLLGIGRSLVRLDHLYRRANVLEDGRWLTALAAAQNRVGVKHGTALLISDEISSPISWGVIRPVIMIDPKARAETGRAEAIIAHELAHVQRLDWLKLIVARVVVALFWFNPLVWALASRCHQLREEAADDAVLRMKVPISDYADLLVAAVRHSNARQLAANGVAPSRSSIAKRVNHVLDLSRPRRAAPLAWVAAAVAVALTGNAALAASEPVLQRSRGTDAQAGERAADELAKLASPQARALARAMRSANWSLRRVPGNTTFNEPRAIRPLLLALRDDDATVRRIAVWGLSEMRPTPDPLATPAVSRLLSDPSPAVRAEAAGAIGDFQSVKTSRSIEKLLLTDPSPDVRARAAHALGDIQDPGSQPTLEVAVRDPNGAVSSEARWALRQVLEAGERSNQ